MGREAELAAAERAVVAAAQAAGDRRESMANLDRSSECAACPGRPPPARRSRGCAPPPTALATGFVDPSASSNLCTSRSGLLDEGEVGLDERHEAVAQAHHETVERVSRAHRGGAGGGARSLHLDGATGRPGSRADPKGRRRRPAGCRLSAAGSSRIGRSPAHRRTRSRSGARGGARGGGRCGRGQLGCRRRSGAAIAQS